MAYITFALYRGTSWVSRIIKGRGKYSHIEGVLKDGSCVGAWHIDGVTHKDEEWKYYESNLLYSLSKNHKPGTVVDLFQIKCTKEQADEFEKLLLAEIGKKYDFWSIFCFIVRTPVGENGKWFCSELIFAILIQLGIWIQVGIKASEVTPNIIGISPVKIFVKQITTV